MVGSMAIGNDTPPDILPAGKGTPSPFPRTAAGGTSRLADECVNRRIGPGAALLLAGTGFSIASGDMVPCWTVIATRGSLAKPGTEVLSRRVAGSPLLPTICASEFG